MEKYASQVMAIAGVELTTIVYKRDVQAIQVSTLAVSELPKNMIYLQSACGRATEKTESLLTATFVYSKSLKKKTATNHEIHLQ